MHNESVSASARSCETYQHARCYETKCRGRMMLIGRNVSMFLNSHVKCGWLQGCYRRRSEGSARDCGCNRRSSPKSEPRGVVAVCFLHQRLFCMPTHMNATEHLALRRYKKVILGNQLISACPQPLKGHPDGPSPETSRYMISHSRAYHYQSSGVQALSAP